MKNKLLVICATHGNERIGIETVERLRAKKLDCYFDCVIGNPLAMERNIRFCDCDLNRSYPGEKRSGLYEKKRACEILSMAEGYEYVLDMHEASCGTDNFIIIPRKRRNKVFPIDLIDLEVALLWPDPVGPLGSVLKNAVELEFGVKDKGREAIISVATDIVEKFILGIYADALKQKKYPKKIYRVYGKLNKTDFKGDIGRLKDFEKVNVNGENFYPLLVGQYLGEGVVCYKMKL
ncbi:MAG: succinylglutamate desuccinylase/aspartoacylase family protein [Candidatus Pacebacteria bacterium]|nr:succinylglutamate desuccinylase/aspartoacylase family protein [Candidatus Paceibacterota bacterium]